MSETRPVDVYLALGSNLGDREANLREALKLLSEKMRPVKISSVYETEPEGEAKQPRYLNQAAHMLTTLTPVELLTLVKGFEFKMGRTGPSGANRIIDIDILIYGSQVIKSPELIIPHPRLTRRAFVLVPLAEIAPNLVHPVEGKTVMQLLEELKNRSGVVTKSQESKNQAITQ